MKFDRIYVDSEMVLCPMDVSWVEPMWESLFCNWGYKPAWGKVFMNKDGLYNYARIAECDVDDNDRFCCVIANPQDMTCDGVIEVIDGKIEYFTVSEKVIGDALPQAIKKVFDASGRKYLTCQIGEAMEEPPTIPACLQNLCSRRNGNVDEYIVFAEDL